ncbi:hypothetical protein PQX77_016628 [Marasmius sp. AFHP31]|nr:hypothetical protein PQX77_016628 [Marasmius sp. AFHP31]
MAFVGSSQFTIEGDANNIVQGNQNVYNIQTAYFQVEADEDGKEYKEYRTIIRGDIYKLQDVFWHQTLDGNGSVLEQLVYIAEINDPDGSGGSVARFTVLAYRGSRAREAWKSEFIKFSQDFRSDRVQLFAINRSKIPALIFYGDLLPFGQLTDNGLRTGMLSGVNLGALARSLASLPPTMWFNHQNGFISRNNTRALVSSGIHLEPSLPTVLRNEASLKYFLGLGRDFDRMFVKTMAYRTSIQAYGATQTNAHRVSVFRDARLSSTMTDTSELVAVRSGGGNYKCSIDGGGCLSRSSRTQMDNGFTRFRLHANGTHHRRLCIHFDYDMEEEMSRWLVQADGVFCRLGVSVNEARMNDYALNLPRFYLKGALSKLPSRRRRRVQRQNQDRANLYLFIRTIPISSSDPSPCSTTTNSLHFWSFSSLGSTPIPPKECRSLGLPTKLVPVTEWTRYSWPGETYEVIRRYAEAKGFGMHRRGMDGSEFAGYLGMEVGWEIAAAGRGRVEESLEEVEGTLEGSAAEGDGDASGAFGALSRAIFELVNRTKEKSIWAAVGDIPAYGF